MERHDETELAFTEFEMGRREAMVGTFDHALAGPEEETVGCMVLGCGATKTFGSIKPLEKIVDKQRAAGIDTSSVTVDVTDRPRFGFADGDAERCSCKAQLPLRADGQQGAVGGHALNTKNDR